MNSNRLSADAELIVIGGGLAGTMLAWQAHWHGRTIHWIDPREHATASRVAAGIVNPVAGRNLAPLRGGVGELQEATAFYRRVDREIADPSPLFEERTIVRHLLDQRMVSRFNRRLEAGDYSELADRREHSLGPGYVTHPNLAELSGGGRVAVNRFLDKTWAHFSSLGQTEKNRVSPEQLMQVSGDQTVVFCLGAEEASSGLFGGEGFRPAKGEILDLQIPELENETRIVVGRKWLLPLGAGRFRAGATYDLERLDHQVTAEAESQILDHLGQFVSASVSVVGAQAAVRPVYRRGQPVVKRHQDFPSAYLFNGFGSKGCLHGPVAARRLAEHLFEGAEFPPDANVPAHV